MYGLLLENMADFIKTTYGEDQWEQIRREAMVDMPSFSTHQVYPEALLPRLARVACKVGPESPENQQSPAHAISPFKDV